MRPERSYMDYLADILDAIGKAEEFMAGMIFEDFAKDDKTLFAVVRALEIIGEASKKIPDSVKAQYPELSWREMAGMRDKLVHDYFGVNSEVVWNTVLQDLPPMKNQLRRILNDMGE